MSTTMTSIVAPQVKAWKDLYWSSEEFTLDGAKLHCTFAVYVDKSDDVFVAEIPERKANITIRRLNASLNYVSSRILFPKWPVANPEQLKVSQNPLAPDAIVNRSLLDKYIILKEYGMLGIISSEIMHQVRAMDAISRESHPYIVQYHGCQVRHGYITGIVQQTLPLDLNHYLAKGVTMSIEAFITIIKSAVTHMHAIGWVHNDIRPENILVDDQGEPYLTGFSMCRRIGEPLPILRGGDEWVDRRFTMSHPHQDEYAVSMIEQWLYNRSIPYELPPGYIFGDWSCFEPQSP